MSLAGSCFSRKRTYALLAILMLASISIGFPGFTKASFDEGNILYTQLELSKSGLSREVFTKAMNGWNLLRPLMGASHLLSIVDFSQSSKQKRLYVIDPENSKLLFQTYVAHGRNSGEEFAESFSNRPESYQSSPGFYITGEEYNGKHGLSLQLRGMETGINDLAEKRAIVLHGADYVSEDFIRRTGRLGRSLGCPAVPIELCRPIIEQIKSGSCFFIFTGQRS